METSRVLDGACQARHRLTSPAKWQERFSREQAPDILRRKGKTFGLRLVRGSDGGGGSS